MLIASRHAPLPKRISAGKARHLGVALLFATAWLLVTLVPTVSAQPADGTSQQPSIEQHRIEYLIDSVAALENASFIRNDQSYDASKAASHMRLKWRLAGSRVKTAEDFIRYCGTGSSTSGTPYTIRFSDGHTETSASFLQHKLAQYRPKGGPAAGK